MINRADRNTAINLLSRLLSSEITNWEIDDAWPYNSDDRGVVAIGKVIWCFYSDFPEQKILKDSFNQKELHIIKRALLFLKCSCAYPWPDYSFETENVRWYDYCLFRSRQVRKREWEKFSSAGAFEYWPFLNEDQYSKAKKKRGHIRTYNK